MVKTPRTRHSKPQRDPVTIDLQPDEVVRVEEAAAEAAFAGPANDAVEPSDRHPEPADAAAQAAPPSDVNEEAKADIAEAASEPVTEKPLGYDFEPEKTAASAPAPRDQKPAKAAVAPKRSGLSTLSAGLLGGAVALAGAGALQFVGLLGYPGGAQVAGMVDGVESEVAALKADIAILKERGSGQSDGRIDELSQALDQVKGEVATLTQAVQAGGAGDGAAVAALGAKVGELETAIAGLGGAGNATQPADLAAVNEKIAGLEALAKAAGEAGSVVDGRLGALEQSVSALTAKIDAQAAQPKIALAIAAAALKSAIERGVPFRAEVETFAAVAPDAPDLAALRAYADKGVPTRADILAEADAAAVAMIAADNPPKQDAGYFERLLSSAEALVSVRPIGVVEGPGVPETVARIEAALKAGDLAKASAEYESLPDAAKAAGAAFGDKIKARLDAEKLVDQAIASAMKA